MPGQPSGKADYAEQLVNLAERLAHSQAQPLLSMANPATSRCASRPCSIRARGRAGAPLVAATLAGGERFVLALAPMRVEAVPDQRLIEAARASAVGNDRVRASTRASTPLSLRRHRRATSTRSPSCSAMAPTSMPSGRATARQLLVAAREGHRPCTPAARSGRRRDIGVAGDGNPLIRLRARRPGYCADAADGGADVNAAVPGDGNAFIMAAREGHPDIVRTLLGRDADVNAAVPGDGNAPIMAVREGHLDIVTMRPDGGALIDEVVTGDENALISASGAGYLDVVRNLVDRGANVHAHVWAEQGGPIGRGEWRNPLSMAREDDDSSVGQVPAVGRRGRVGRCPR